MGQSVGDSGIDRSGAYRSAIDGLARALERRARGYRRLIAFVALLPAALVVLALTLHTAAPLAGMLLLVPIAGSFFLTDARLLDRWRSEVLAAWRRAELDLAGLRAAVLAHPLLPRETLEGMMATLPSAGDIVAEQGIPRATRRAVVSAIGAAHRQRADALLLNVVASALVVGAVLAALGLHRRAPLMGLALLGLRPAVSFRLRRRREAVVAVDVAACRREPGFSEADLSRLVASVR